MEKKHLYLFETAIIDEISLDAQEWLVNSLKELKDKGNIDFFINVPCRHRYQFFIYYDDNEYVFKKIIEQFNSSKLYFRSKELM